MTLEILDKKDVELFQSLICKKSGIYLEGNRLDILRTGLCARMESKGFVSPSQYYNFLRFHPDGQRELEGLLSYVAINETHFFRSAAHFAVLRDHIFARYMRENKDGIVRIWSAGCSTGEEPYSIAMVILDLLRDGKDLRVEILGTDIDREALAEAERGIYGERALRIAEEKYKNRYFTASNGKFEIDKRLREMVRFEYFNLMESPYPKPSQGNWDIIFCRNVVIYFNRESVRYAANRFYNVLADNGYLFMGPTETLDGISDEFALVEIDGTFIYVKRPYSAVVARDAKDVQEFKSSRVQEFKSHEVKKVPRTRRQKTAIPKESLEDAESVYKEASELFAREQVDAALSKIEMYIKLDPDDARGYLLAGKIFADRGIYERAASEFERATELEPLLTEAHYLLGVIYQRLGQTARAIDEFKKSIYIDRTCVLSYFGLARIYQSSDMRNDALREFRNALRILEKLQDDEIVLFSGGLTVRLLTQICLKSVEVIEAGYSYLSTTPNLTIGT